jgi:hypothetical protein
MLYLVELPFKNTEKSCTEKHCAKSRTLHNGNVVPECEGAVYDWSAAHDPEI